MPKYRARPNVITAYHVRPWGTDPDGVWEAEMEALAELLGGTAFTADPSTGTPRGIHVNSPDGIVAAHEDQFIVVGSNDAITVWKGDAFREAYEFLDKR